MSKISNLGYILMIITYTIILVEKTNIIVGLITSMVTASLVLIFQNYVFPNFNNNYDEKYFVSIALKAAESPDLETKNHAYKQLFQFSTSHDYKTDIKDKAFYGLCDLLKKEKDKIVKNNIISLICKIYNIRSSNNQITTLENLSKI